MISYTQQFREVRPNGDVFVSVYAPTFQRAYVVRKAELDYWQRQDRKRLAQRSAADHKPHKAGENATGLQELEGKQ